MLYVDHYGLVVVIMFLIKRNINSCANYVRMYKLAPFLVDSSVTEEPRVGDSGMHTVAAGDQ